MRVKLNQDIDLFGEITTVTTLLDNNRAYVAKINYHNRKGKPVTGYRVYIPYEGSEYEFTISQKAYESRAALGQDKLQVNEAKSDIDCGEVLHDTIRLVDIEDIDLPPCYEVIVMGYGIKPQLNPFFEGKVICEYEPYFENQLPLGFYVYYEDKLV